MIRKFRWLRIMLTVHQNLVIFEMSNDIANNDVIQDFAREDDQSEWSILSSYVSIILLVNSCEIHLLPIINGQFFHQENIRI